MPKSDKSIFANASALRDSITKEQEKNITKLYEGWSKDIQEKAKYFERLTTNSSSLMTSYYNQLYNQVKTTGKEVANGVYTNITNGMLEVSDAVVKDAVEWTKGLGFDEKTVSQALSSVPASIVNAISTGSVYGKPGSWSLSKSIWGDSEKILRDIYTIVAGGAAMQQSIAEIADQLSKYVNPTKELLWSGPKGMKIYRRKVDYSSQRLARTLMQHTYQQSFVATTQDNPFITAYRWNSNGSRVCDICKRRDGKIFQKNQLPLDHPNGMCTMEPVVMDQEERLDMLADWVKSDDGTFPEIDAFAKKFGYKVVTKPSLSVDDIVKDYGQTNYKIFKPWYNKLPDNVKKSVDQNVLTSGMNTNQWYKKYILESVKDKVEDVSITVKKITSYNDDINEFIMKYGKPGKNEDVMLWVLEKGALKDVNDLVKKHNKELKDFKEMLNNVDNATNKTASNLDNIPYNKLSGYVKSAEDKLQDDIDKLVEKFGKPAKDEDFNMWVFNSPSPYDKDIFDAAYDISNKYNKDFEEIKQMIKNSSKDKIESAKKVQNTKKVQNELKELINKAKKNGSVKEFLEAENDILSVLSENNIKTLKTYSGSAYKKINAYLRYISDGHSRLEAISMSNIDDKLADHVDDLINAMHQSVKTEKEYVLRRGTDLGDIAGLFMDGDFNSNVRLLKNLSIEELNSMFKGQLGEYASFTSTSSQWNLGFDGDVEIVIKAPEGTSGSSIMSISEFETDEGEFLLAPGTKVKCLGIEESDGHMSSHIRVYLEVIV